MDSIEKWVEAKANLQHYKVLEAKLRLEILDQLFPSAGAGSQSVAIGPYDVKGTFRNNASLDHKRLDECWDKLSDDEQACIKYKPTFLVSKFKELSDNERRDIESCITFKPAMPTLEITLVEE